MQIHLSYLKLFLFLFVFFQSSHSQIKIHKSLTTEDGLIGNRVICIYEDSKGYLWFGTSNGVSRWDGKNFKNYNTLNGLSGSMVFDIKESYDGTIYFATYGTGVSYLKNRLLQILNESNGLPSNWVTKILVRSNGDILFAAEQGKISALREGKIFELQQELGGGISSIWSMYEREDSTLFLGTFKLLEFNAIKRNEYLHGDSYIKNDSYRTIYAIEEDKDGNLFIGTLNGIYLLQNDKLVKLKVNGKDYTNSAVAIKTARDGKTYFCSEDGVLIKSRNGYEYLKKENGLTDNNIWSVWEDSNGVIYFGTKDQGVNIYYPEKLETFLPEKLSGINITSIKKDLSSKIYFGTNDGVLIYNLNSHAIKKILPGRSINSIFVDERNIAYIGTDQGLNVLKNSIISNYSPYSKLSSLNKVWSINYSIDKKIFVGFQGGLFSFEENKLTKLTSIRGHNQYIQDFLFTKDSSLVIGTHGNGLIISKNDNEVRFSPQNGLPDNIINCLYETPEGILLAGTNQIGLAVIQNLNIKRIISIDDGLTSNTITDIHGDSDGNIYISTSKGFCIITNILDSLSIRTLLISDGLVSNNCNLNSTFTDSEGVIWIGTHKGVSKYNSKSDKPISNPPKVYLTGIEIFNEKYPLEAIKLSNQLNYNQNYLKFIYSGINLSAPEKILYKYRLVGVDQDWVESKEDNIQYTSLDDGSYTFEVKARNEWGYWSQPAELAFIINPAWWETWWFRLLVLSTLGFLLWLAFQYRLNYLLKLERLRTKIASDLHDEVGSLLTQISINVDSLSYTKEENKRKEKTNFIRAKSSEVIGIMSDVIWSIDSRNDTLESLADRIHNFGSSFLQQKNISLNFSSEITNPQKSLKPDFRQNIMMIVKEAINNAVKYSDCSKIDIKITSKNDNFELLVVDNGKGLDFEKLRKGNGLKNMNMRAEIIKAVIEFTNKNGLHIKISKNKI